jgi:hypothetical protein
MCRGFMTASSFQYSGRIPQRKYAAKKKKTPAPKEFLLMANYYLFLQTVTRNE